MLFLVVLAILALLVVWMLSLAVDSPGSGEGLAAFAQTLIGAGVVVLAIRLAWEAFRRR